MTITTDQEPRHTIGAVAQRTGLSPDLLRVWERRYGVVDPARPQGGPRLYSDADILRLRLLRRLTEGGHSIGRIADLSVPELTRLLPAEPNASVGPAHGAAAAAPGEPFVAAALAAVEGMDAAGIGAALRRGAVALSAEVFIEGVVIPLLHQVGELWADGRICPAHEHLLSVHVGRVLGTLADTLPVPPGAPVAVAATPRGERHELGALIAAVVAAEEGWAVTYLGPDLPAEDLARAAELLNAPVLLLSAVAGSGGAGDELRPVAEAVGPGVRVLAGGRSAAAGRGGPENLRRLPDLPSLRRELRELAGAGSVEVGA